LYTVYTAPAVFIGTIKGTPWVYSS